MSTARAILPRIWACEVPVQPLRTSSDAAKTKSTEEVEPRLEFYRKYTEGMLRRYMKFSMEAGRVPSMLGRELFRAQVTHYEIHSFEDNVIFVHDVEKCLNRLTGVEKTLVTRIAVQEYTHYETARMLRLPRSTVVRHYNDAIDRLTAIFLELRLLEPEKECQEGGR